MAEFRPVGPRNEWLAGSFGAYASVSTIVPPTPSTRKVQPTSSRATRCTSPVNSSVKRSTEL
jgi:hypothetical protein